MGTKVTHKTNQAKEMAQSVECLLYKHKDLSSSPNTYIKKKKKVGCGPPLVITGERQRQEGPWDSMTCKSRLKHKFQDNKGSRFKN